MFQVLIHGTEEATSSLAEFCHTTGVVQGNVFCPSVGDVIDATTERQIYQVSGWLARVTQCWVRR